MGHGRHLLDAQDHQVRRGASKLNGIADGTS